MDIIKKIFISGNISMFLFILVMIGGILNKKWNLTKLLLKIRPEFSILASLLIIPHIKFYSHKMPVDSSNVKVLILGYILGGLAFIIMIPLFITSFKNIRMKMMARKWRKIQRWAYLFYLLIYLHAMVLLFNKPNIHFSKIIFYTIIFGSYFVFKIKTSLKERQI